MLAVSNGCHTRGNSHRSQTIASPSSPSLSTRQPIRQTLSLTTPAPRLLIEIINAVMKRVTVPFFGSESMIQANGSELNVGTNASACLADWDNDGRKDLILGSGSGDVGARLSQW